MNHGGASRIEDNVRVRDDMEFPFFGHRSDRSTGFWRGGWSLDRTNSAAASGTWTRHYCYWGRSLSRISGVVLSCSLLGDQWEARVAPRKSGNPGYSHGSIRGNT